MPCHAAISKNVLILSPDAEVESVLAEMKKKKLEHAVVLDQASILLGYFSYHNLLKNLLPVSVPVSGGLQIDVAVRAAPGIAKRLRKVYPAKVSELMERKLRTVFPQTPIWEGVNALIAYGEPLFVIEDEKGKFMGIITSASALEELQRMQESETS